uniref:Ribokinase n=1 Tax=Panagrellus redivivus TaxID=6233 RepID=A0A7E4ZQZ5_PANRE
MSASKPVVVVGSIVQDCVSYTERFPKPGEAVRGHDFKLGSGGKGANQSVQAAKLGASVTFVARVGNDVFGESNIKSLREAGVNVEHIEKSETAPTAAAIITVDSHGENTIVVALGANMELSVERVNSLEDLIKQAALVMVEYEIQEETSLAALKLARKNGVRTFYNAAPGHPDMRKDLLQYTDILCTNENETEFIVGRHLSTLEDFTVAAKECLELGPTTVVVTMGSRGVLVVTKDAAESFPVPKVKAIDTTGAGDSFCGALASLIATHPDELVAPLAKKAAQVAAISVQRHGTQSSYPSLEEVRAAGVEI